MNPNSYGFGNVDCLLFILHLTQLYSLYFRDHCYPILSSPLLPPPAHLARGSNGRYRCRIFADGRSLSTQQSSGVSSRARRVRISLGNQV